MRARIGQEVSLVLGFKQGPSQGVEMNRKDRKSSRRRRSAARRTTELVLIGVLASGGSAQFVVQVPTISHQVEKVLSGADQDR